MFAITCVGVSSDYVTCSDSSSCFIRSTKGVKYICEHLTIQLDIVCRDIFTPLLWNSCSIRCNADEFTYFTFSIDASNDGVTMVSQCCCEADLLVCFHAGIRPDDHRRFLHIPRRYEFQQSMILVHGEAFCMFHPAYDASCLSHKKHQVVLRKHCTVEVSLPKNLSDQDPVVPLSLFLRSMLCWNDLFSRRLPERLITGSFRFIKK